MGAGKATLLKMLTEQLMRVGGWWEQGKPTVIGHIMQQTPPVPPEHIASSTTSGASPTETA